MNFDTVLILNKKETYNIIIIYHYESPNRRNNHLGLLFYYLSHLIPLDFECTSFFFLQVSLKHHLQGNIIKVFNQGFSKIFYNYI